MGTARGSGSAVESERVGEAAERPRSPRSRAVWIGTVVRARSAGELLVQIVERGLPRIVPADALCYEDDLTPGVRVAILFRGDEEGRAVVLGPIVSEPGGAPAVPRQADRVVDSTIAHGDRVAIVGEREIVFECGKASLTLHDDGRVRIRGTDVLSRSTGLHRVQGAAVRIN